MSRAHASRYEPLSRGNETLSRSSLPAITSSTAAASRTVRVSGPTCPTWSHPAREDQVLDRDRNAVQRAERLALHDRDFGVARRGARLIGGEETERVHARIDRLDPREHGGHHLDRRDLLLPDARREVERGGP